MKVWVLTDAYNDYDQHGDSLVAIFEKKPTIEKLAKALEMNDTGSLNIMSAVALLEHIRNGGGRRDNEYHWYDLEEVECK